MERLTILSPHRDDAVFSMGLALTYLRPTPVSISVVNFFTRSSYAPYAAAGTIEEATQIRRQEDEGALAEAHPGIEEISLHLEDAPVRLSITFDRIMQVSAQALLQPSFIEELRGAIERTSGGGLLAVPLAVGNHVDHVAVRRAALGVGSVDMAFYEDQPYTARAQSGELEEKVNLVQAAVGQPLVPHILAVENGANRKRQLAGLYPSQITAEEASEIGQFALRHGGGERLWVAQGSRRWKALLTN